MAEKKCWYGWALKTHALGDPGLDYAQALATNALARRKAQLRHTPLPPDAATLIEELAERDGVSPATVRRAIRRTREALFGAIGDRAIQHRLQRRPKPRLDRWKECAREGCGKKMKPTRAGHVYCSSHCRVKVFRARRAAPPAT